MSILTSVLTCVANWEDKVRRGRCASPQCRGRPLKKRKHCQKCRLREWRSKYPVKCWFARLRYSASKRKIAFNLTYTQFLFWCQESGFIQKKLAKKDVTVDRIENEKGYELGNLQILTNVENGYKSNYVATKIGRYKARDGDPF